jgi:hypothetical protein
LLQLEHLIVPITGLPFTLIGNLSGSCWQVVLGIPFEPVHTLPVSLAKKSFLLFLRKRNGVNISHFGGKSRETLILCQDLRLVLNPQNP